MYYADIHTHILSGVDDGPKTDESSLKMIDAAYRSGTRVLFLTPHCRGGFDAELVSERTKKLKSLIGDTYDGLIVYGGCEIFCSVNNIQKLVSGRLPTLAGSRYVLIEFDPRIFYNELRSNVQRIVQSGYIPIIAHAERYGCITKSGVSELIDIGAYIQLNSRSVLGKSGFRSKQFCKKLLKRRQVHFIASDCHDAVTRHPELDKCHSAVTAKYGESYAKDLFYGNQQKVINDTEV